MNKWYSWKETNLRTKVLLVLLFLPSVVVFGVMVLGVGIWDGMGWWQNKLAEWLGG